MRAISVFNFDAGTSSFWWRARMELRIRVTKSATGSVKLILSPPFPVRSGLVFSRTAEPAGMLWLRRGLIYQLDLTTPGISPRSANWRKHKRHRPNLRRYARGRPQILQRLCWRLENFGLRASLTRFAVVAIRLPKILSTPSGGRVCQTAAAGD